MYRHAGGTSIPLKLDAEVLSRLPKRASAQSPTERRESARFRFLRGQKCQLLVDRAGSISVADSLLRDVSHKGFGVLVGTFLHAGTKCMIRLPVSRECTREQVELEGEIAWCQHVSGTVHEAGLRITECDRVHLVDQSPAGSDNPGAENRIAASAVIEHILRRIRNQLEDKLDAELLNAVLADLEKQLQANIAND